MAIKEVNKKPFTDKQLVKSKFWSRFNAYSQASEEFCKELTPHPYADTRKYQDYAVGHGAYHLTLNVDFQKETCAVGVYFRDVYYVLCTLYVRKVLVYLEDDVISNVHDGSCRSASKREIEISVGIHRGYLHHSYVYRSVSLSVVRRQISEYHRHEVAEALIAELSFIA